MEERPISNISIIINAIVFFILGIILIFIPTSALNFFHITISLTMAITGITTILFNLIRKKNIQNIVMSLGMIIISIFFFYHENSFLAIFPIAFGVYILICAIIKLVTFLIYKGRKFKGFYRLLLNALLDFILAPIAIFNPLRSIKSLTIVLGGYFILVATNYFIDFLEENDIKKKRRRFRITLPNWLSLLIPYAFYVKINKFLSKEITNVTIDKNVSGEVDLEIYIGVKESNIGKFGHADLYFDGKIYSYGHYDEDSKRLFDTVGDGMLFIVNDKLKYLRFCTEYSKKTIFAFGITLTDEQKRRVREELDKVQSYTYRWKCLQEVDNSQEHKDYASCLYRATKAKFYKFNQSNYRLYFALWSNCVKLVDNVLGAAGGDILRLNGFITPGAYYYYLNNEFKRKKSNVIRKEIITNKDIFTQNK